MKNTLDEQKLSGAVWSIVWDNGEISTDAAGYKNTQTKQLLHPTDKVQVGSISKTILAAGFLRMASLGLINLDDPVKKYLPHLPIQNEFNNTHPVTIKHLLDHTSGLTDAKLWHIFSTTATPDTSLETVYLNNKNLLKVQARPGSIYSYSNIAYNILGMVIESISKQRYEDYLDTALLKPLGMVNSSFHFISQGADKALAFGHFDKGEPVSAMPMYLRAAGQLTTTAEDIGKFLRFMMSDGTINGITFIDDKYLKGVGKQEHTDAYKVGVPFGDALGAYSRDRYGVVGLAKNGNTLGFSAMIYMFPAYKKAFFVAFNMDSEKADYDLFNKLLVKQLGLPKLPLINIEKIIGEDFEKFNGYYIPVVTKVEPFYLLDIVFSHTKVELLKTSVMLKPFQGKNKTLTYQRGNLFSMKDRTNISHALYSSANKDLFISDGVKTIKKISGYKIFAIATSLLLGIAGLIYLFIIGWVDLVKHKLNFINEPRFWVFVSIFILMTSIIFIAAQPFMRMGDLTMGNVLLFACTLTLPVFSIVSIIMIIKKQKLYLQTVSFWATAFVIQFCLLLLLNDLLPISMWK